ncbi:Nucleotide-diphospho-sugar transferase [Rhizoctonia solani]|uniref:Translation initiation factor eIF2B subunit epsilon n=1 Tax=Rhizoctonia solani TaxID=456999 RepID=A0A8H7HDZ1_9AGAM|nr:Nucleotide-diphospho-sugar transferase [Rhizoctonia solani]
MPPLSGQPVACSLLNSPFPFLSGRLTSPSTYPSLLFNTSSSFNSFDLEFIMSAPVETTPAVVAENPKVTEEVTKEEAAPVTTEAATSETPAAPATTEATPEIKTAEPTEATPEAVPETTEATATEAVPATEAAPAEAAPESPKPKSPGLFSKLLAPFKAEKKPKAPKSPKKEKKKEEVEPVVAATTEEAPKPEEVKEEAPVAEAAPTEPQEPSTSEAAPAPVAEPVVAIVEPEDAVKSTETPAEEAAPATEAPKVEEKKADEKKLEEKKPSKAGRRLSARVTGFFKPKHKPEETSPLPAKVDENPPKIDEPTPVAPLENPTEEAKTAEVAPVSTEEETKPAETSATPAVATTAFPLDFTTLRLPIIDLITILSCSAFATLHTLKQSTFVAAIQVSQENEIFSRPPQPVMAPKDDEDVLQAVILADSFNTKFEPLSVDTPRVLLPVCNAPLLDWAFECLASAGVDEVFVFCVAHVDQIKEAIANSQWSKPNSGMAVTTIVSREARSVGDAMRELDAKQVLTSDFVLLTGDVVSNIRLDEVIKEHKERRKVSKDAIMTCVVKEVGKMHRSKPVSEKNIFVLDAQTNECVYYEYQQANPPKQKFSFLREIFDKHQEVDVRTDLMDCSIDICSVDVPVLFTENFDYQDLRKDFMHGVLTSDILGKTMHCHIARSGYAARVRDTRSYASVSKDIISRWSFPLVPDNNHPTQHDYDYRAGNKYIAKKAELSRNSRVGKNTMVGPSTRVEDDAFVTNSVLGASCEIGSGSTISGSYLFNDVHIGVRCQVVDSIIGDGVRLERGVKVDKGCIIAKGVVLGEGTVLSPFTRISKEQPEDAEEWEGSDQVELGPGSTGWVWPDDKHRESIEAESEDEDEETFANVRLGRLADTCSDIETYESDQASTLASESESDISPPISPTSSTSELPGIPSLDSAADFQSECTQSLKRAFDEQHTIDNAAIELKTLRMASNVPLPQVRQAVIEFIIQKLSDEGAGRPEVKRTFERWGGLLKQIGGYDEAETLLQFQRVCCKTPERSRLFPAVLTELYQNELIEEDGLTDWFMDPQSKGTNSHLSPEMHAPYDQLRVIGGQLLQQLRAQDSESEDEEDE